MKPWAQGDPPTREEIDTFGTLAEDEEPWHLKRGGFPKKDKKEIQNLKMRLMRCSEFESSDFLAHFGKVLGDLPVFHRQAKEKDFFIDMFGLHLKTWGMDGGAVGPAAGGGVRDQF